MPILSIITTGGKVTTQCLHVWIVNCPIDYALNYLGNQSLLNLSGFFLASITKCPRSASQSALYAPCALTGHTLWAGIL